jgi:hypothetical protein
VFYSVKILYRYIVSNFDPRKGEFVAKTKKLPKWWSIIPAGKAGDEEQKFFIALSRHPKYEWRTVSALSKESTLTKERVEEIINKYFKIGMVIQHPKNEDTWAYWERVPDAVPDDPSSITKTDQDGRIDKAMHSIVGDGIRKSRSDNSDTILNESFKIINGNDLSRHLLKSEANPEVEGYQHATADNYEQNPDASAYDPADSSAYEPDKKETVSEDVPVEPVKISPVETPAEDVPSQTQPLEPPSPPNAVAQMYGYGNRIIN